MNPIIHSLFPLFQKIKKNDTLSFFDSGHIAQIFWSDFNNDGISDYLIYHAKLTSGGTSHVNNDVWFDYEDIYGPSWGGLTQEIRLGKIDANGKISFELSTDFALSDEFMIGKTESNFDHLVAKF